MIVRATRNSVLVLVFSAGVVIAVMLQFQHKGKMFSTSNSVPNLTEARATLKYPHPISIDGSSGRGRFAGTSPVTSGGGASPASPGGGGSPRVVSWP